MTDREALIALFKAANGAFWVKEKGWCTSADLRDWHGVTVNDHGRVVELHLQRNNLQGKRLQTLGRKRLIPDNGSASLCVAFALAIVEGFVFFFVTREERISRLLQSPSPVPSTDISPQQSLD